MEEGSGVSSGVSGAVEANGSLPGNERTPHWFAKLIRARRDSLSQKWEVQGHAIHKNFVPTARNRYLRQTMKISSLLPLAIFLAAFTAAPFSAHGESSLARLSVTERFIDTTLAKTIAKPQPLTPLRPNSIVRALPHEIVTSLPGGITRSLPTQIVRSLPGQMIEPLPGQIIRALPGQIIQSLPGQIVQ